MLNKLKKLINNEGTLDMSVDNIRKLVQFIFLMIFLFFLKETIDWLLNHLKNLT